MAKFKPYKQVISTYQDVGEAVGALNVLPLEDREKYVLTIEEAGDARTAAQRRWQWKVYTEIGRYYGEHKEVIRKRMMVKFAVNIFYRDDINGSTRTLDAIKAVKAAGMGDQYWILIEQFVASITSNSFSPKQNSEYMECIVNHCAHEGVPITIPDQGLMAYEAER